nr:hypothetical protein CFP56_03133 [Quercus suber]
MARRETVHTKVTFFGMSYSYTLDSSPLAIMKLIKTSNPDLHGLDRRQADQAGAGAVGGDGGVELVEDLLGDDGGVGGEGGVEAGADGGAELAAELLLLDEQVLDGLAEVADEEQAGGEGGLLADDVVQQAEDDGLEADDGVGDVEGVGLAPRGGLVGGGGDVGQVGADHAGLVLDLERGGHAKELVGLEGVEGVVQGDGIGLQFADLGDDQGGEILGALGHRLGGWDRVGRGQGGESAGLELRAELVDVPGCPNELQGERGRGGPFIYRTISASLWPLRTRAMALRILRPTEHGHEQSRPPLQSRIPLAGAPGPTGEHMIRGCCDMGFSLLSGSGTGRVFPHSRLARTGNGQSRGTRGADRARSASDSSCTLLVGAGLARLTGARQLGFQERGRGWGVGPLTDSKAEVAGPRSRSAASALGLDSGGHPLQQG